MCIVDDALIFAAQHHRGQEDKNGMPYIWHPIRVAQALKKAGYSKTFQAVGLLHDTIEDTDATLELVRERFGDVVAGGVDGMSRRRDPKTGEWSETYEEYVERCAGNLISRKVKRFDVYDNADPRRYCARVPTKRYYWTLEFLNALEREDVLTEWEGVHRGM